MVLIDFLLAEMSLCGGDGLSLSNSEGKICSVSPSAYVMEYRFSSSLNEVTVPVYVCMHSGVFSKSS